MVVVAVLHYMRKSVPPVEIADIELSEAEEERLREAMAEMEEAEEPAY